MTRIAAAVLLVTAALCWRLPELRIDNTARVWLPSGSAGVRDYQDFRARFGEDSLLLAFVTGGGRADRAEEWKQLIADLRSTPGVARVLAPPFLEDAGAGPGPAPLRYYLASADGRAAAVAIVPEAALEVAARTQLVDRLEQQLARWKLRLGDFQLAGADVITHDLDAGSRESMQTLAPLVVAVMALVLYGAARAWPAVLAAFLAVGLAATWSLGLMALAGRPLTLVVATLPAILAVVCVIQTLHLVSCYQALPAAANLSRAKREKRWRKAVRATFRPAFLCAATTAAGFVSLATSRIAPLRDLGIFAAAGVGFSFALGVTLVPALLAAFPSVQPRGDAAHGFWTPARAAGYTSWIRRHTTAILAASGVFLTAAGAGIAGLRFESHILEFFPASHRIPQGYGALERHLLAPTPLELVVEGAPDVLLADRALESYRALLESILREEPQVRQVVSVLLEPGRGTNLEFAVPPAELREALEREGLPEGAETFVRLESGRYWVRTTLLASTGSSHAVQALVERLRVRIAAALPPGVSAGITGGAVLLIEGQVALLITQIQSFAVALALILLLVLPAFREWRLAVVVAPPNLLPIAATLGAMGFAGIAVDTATVTVAGIALGIAFDNTIHILHRTLQARREGLDLEPAVARALWEAGRPAAVSGLALAAGFAVFGLAPFPPTAYFGLLVGGTALTGALCDVLVLPALAFRFAPLLQPRRERTSTRALNPPGVS